MRNSVLLSQCATLFFSQLHQEKEQLRKEAQNLMPSTTCRINLPRALSPSIVKAVNKHLAIRFESHLWELQLQSHNLKIFITSQYIAGYHHRIVSNSTEVRLHNQKIFLAKKDFSILNLWKWHTNDELEGKGESKSQFNVVKSSAKGKMFIRFQSSLTILGYDPHPTRKSTLKNRVNNITQSEKKYYHFTIQNIHITNTSGTIRPLSQIIMLKDDHSLIIIPMLFWIPDRLSKTGYQNNVPIYSTLLYSTHNQSISSQFRC